MTSSRRILVATFGSAGDLLPLVPGARRLQAAGHDVRFAVPRSLGLYVRAWRLPMFALGTGMELRVFEDEGLVTTRFGGWASWWHTGRRYVVPALAGDVARLDRIVSGWRPDLIVSSGFSVAARVAAVRRQVPRLELSIYPQHWRRLPGSSFGGPVRKAVAGWCRSAPASTGMPDLITSVAWGVGSDGLLLHDEALLGADDVGGAPLPPVVGFPYWDGGDAHVGDLERLDRWLGESHDPAVLVTLGSFLGGRQREAWLAVADAVVRLGVRAAFVEPTGRWREPEIDGRPGLITVGFVPISRVAAGFDAVVHHGGLGTTFGALRAGRPAVVVPQAFDQPFNAQLVALREVGVDASESGVGPGLERALCDPKLVVRAMDTAQALVPAERACSRVVREILDRLERR